MISSISPVKVDVGPLDNSVRYIEQKTQEKLYSPVQKELGGQVVKRKEKPMPQYTLGDIVAAGNSSIREKIGGGKIGEYNAMDRKISNLIGTYHKAASSPGSIIDKTA
ncbi:hypothetical protein GOV06_05785 [Candidatus Woesearchaeota archaeon]|nr:hypothetical protein [Candidatus Woesearchaeota archaeon]